MKNTYSVAAVGSATDVNSFSGIPFHFLSAAQKMKLPFMPWEMDMDGLGTNRMLWNVGRLIMGERPGGYQYSDSFKKILLKQIPQELLSTSVISFNQHFPPAEMIQNAGGKMYHYIDATFTQLLDRYGFDNQLGKDIKRKTLTKEKEAFDRAEKIFTFQKWAADSVINDYGISSAKVIPVLPGANILFDDRYEPQRMNMEGIGKERPLTLGFVGKDWKRKGLLILAEVRNSLERRGWNVLIKCAGNAPKDFQMQKGIDFAGFIDKRNDTSGFIAFLESCDIGCLFSEAEFSSISVLEFIAVGRPVAGFVVDGMSDLYMPEVSIRFNVGDTVEMIADQFEKYLINGSYREELNYNAVARTRFVRWERSINSIMENIKG